MRYGLFADVHSNWPALRAVLNAFEDEEVDHYIFLGDIVGYGAHPKECIAALKKLKEGGLCDCVAGNHDFAICGLTDTSKFNPLAKAAADWTIGLLTHQEKTFLSELEIQKRMNEFIFVHANLTDPASWAYIKDSEDAYLNFFRLRDSVCFIGHTHIPGVFQLRNNVVQRLKVSSLVIEKDTQYIVDIGSVGQPRDGNPAAAYAIYDTDEISIDIKRCSYEIEEAQKEINNAGLPEFLSQRLSLGS